MTEFNWTVDDIKRAQRDFSNNFMRLDCIRTESYDVAIDCMTECIEKKAADVQPVKHGRWIDCTFYDPYEKSWEQNCEFKCSNCGHKIYNKPNDDNLFCGHCGARMDGDTK